MKVPEHDPEVREKVAWEQSDDVQFGTWRNIVAKTGFFVTKCRFTRRTATLRWEQRFRPNLPSIPEPESLMSRRQLTLVVLTLASMIATACGTSPTAPRGDAPKDSGVTVGSG
jgi:hypothetical protein